MLKKLTEYSGQRHEDQLPSLYEHTPVAHIVLLKADGQPLSERPISRVDETTTRGRRGIDMAAPVIQRASNIKPLLMADNGEYTFGRADNPARQPRAQRAHQAYLEILRRCSDATAEASVYAVNQFYSLGGHELLELDEDWDYSRKITFDVQMEDGRTERPIDLLSVQQFWLQEHLPDQESLDQCLVCGQRKPVLERLQSKIKGIRGGQASGTSLISANSDAFESYGLNASRTGPTCRECAEGFTRAMNNLISGDSTHLYVGDTTFIFWTYSTGFNLATFLQEPDPQEVKALLQLRSDRNSAAAFDTTPFYAAALSASGGRAVVRDWIDTTVGNAQRNIARWFEMQHITNPRAEDPGGANPRPISLWQLADATVPVSRGQRQPTRIPVTTPRSLFRSALQGTPLPLDIAAKAVQRNRAERNVTRARAALIKLVLLSREIHPLKEAYMVGLETENPSPAYHCGRLLAVIDQVQRAAMPGVNATVVDRFYGAASSTPAVIFGTLLRGAQPHLSRLKRDNRGAQQRLERDLEDVIAHIAEWPATLTLQEQALFSLGYYHQQANNRAQAIAARNARNQAPDADKQEEN